MTNLRICLVIHWCRGVEEEQHKTIVCHVELVPERRWRGKDRAGWAAMWSNLGCLGYTRWRRTDWLNPIITYPSRLPFSVIRRGPNSNCELRVVFDYLFTLAVKRGREGEDMHFNWTRAYYHWATLVISIDVSPPIAARVSYLLPSSVSGLVGLSVVLRMNRMLRNDGCPKTNSMSPGVIFAVHRRATATLLNDVCLWP